MSAAIEIPALIALWLALRFLRRQPTAIFILLLGAVSLFLIQLVPKGKTKYFRRIPFDPLNSIYFPSRFVVDICCSEDVG